MKPTKTPNGKYMVRWRSRRGNKEVRHKRTFDRRKDAVEFIENMAAERRRDHQASKRTFNEYADRYLTAASHRVKPRTLDSYRLALDHARAFLGTRAVGTLRASDCEAFLAHLDSQPRMRRARSIRWAWQAFSATLNMAVRDDALPSNPADKVDLPTSNSRGEQKFEARFLTPEEVARVSTYLDDTNPPYGLLVRFLAYTGLRAGEVAGLELRHVKLWHTPNGWAGKVRVEQTKRLVKGEWATTTTKTGATGDVPMPPWLAAQMHEYVDNHPRAATPTAPLWPNRKRGGYTHGRRGSKVEDSAAHGVITYTTPVEPGAFYRNIFKPACPATGLGKVRLHDLRHTAASMWLANGVKVERVASWLRHSSIVVTYSIYTHVTRGEDDHAAVAHLPEPQSSTVVTPINREGRSA